MCNSVVGRRRSLLAGELGLPRQELCSLPSRKLYEVTGLLSALRILFRLLAHEAAMVTSPGIGRDLVAGRRGELAGSIACQFPK